MTYHLHSSEMQDHPRSLTRGKLLACMFGVLGILIGASLLVFACEALTQGMFSGPGGALSALFGAIVLLVSGFVTVRNALRPKR